MRSRYYKLARRRAIWESEDSYMRPWRHSRLWATRYCDYKPMSSTDASSSEAKDPHRDSEAADDHKTVYNDFDSFRTAVDRAIARDPYGTLFGRRLQSPPSSNNSSWTSFSWFTDTKEIKEDPTTSSVKPPHSGSRRAPAEKSSTATPTNTTQKIPQETTISYSEDEYEYDPITMRKVPMKKHQAESESKTPTSQPESSKNLNSAGPKAQPPLPETAKHSTTPSPKKQGSEPSRTKQSSEDQSTQPFLQSLFFQEHGANIPVKTFKPHTVYGYGSSDKKTTAEPVETSPHDPKKNFDSSKKHQLRDLMSRVKGNNIDTTALFTEAIPQPKSHFDPKIVEDTAPKKPRDSPEPDDTLPLFSGTTYEARADKEVNRGPSDWLTREGFGPAGDKNQSESPKDSVSYNRAQKLNTKLEPSLDRVQARTAQESKDRSARLQTILDRQQAAFKRRFPSPDEEVDTAATLKETEASKATKRAKLENDFAARQKAGANETDFSPKSRNVEISASKLTKTFNNVWEHIREHPDGIVARTMKSMTNFNESYKKYIRPDAVKGLTDKLIFKDESLSKTPSIYKQVTKPVKVEPFTPSHEMPDAETGRQQRAASLREAVETSKKDKEAKDAQISNLATEIQAVYESEYGVIDSNHRQPVSSSQLGSIKSAATPSASESSQSNASKQHPLLTASVKPGVVTNPTIEEHITKFEPKLAKFVDNAKAIHAQLREIRSQTQELQKARSVHANSSKKAEEVHPGFPTWSEVIQGTKDVRRALHETRSAIRSIETGRPDIAWKVSSISGSNFGRKRIDLNTEPASETETPDAVSNKDAKIEPEIQKPSQTPEESSPKIVPEPVHTPSGSPTWNDEQIPPVESMRGIKFDSPYLILSFESSTEKVKFSPMNEPTMNMPKSTNLIHILGRLKHAPAFLKHFQAMQSAGYSLYNGSDNMLIFQKVGPKQATKSVVPETVLDAMPVSEAAPPAPVKDAATAQPLQEAATVLDELPTDLDPPAGPAAPTAPPSRLFKARPRVRRQEKVFSGTIRPNAVVEESPTISKADKEVPKAPKESLWRRFTRTVRRTILTLTAIGAGAYAIGVIAEGLGAHSQRQKGIESGEAPGPRKRIVMTGQRPGIFSTEGSR